MAHLSVEGKVRRNGRPLTVEDLARHKRLPPEFLRSLGLYDGTRGVVIPYFDPGGPDVVLGEKTRTALAARDGSYWPRGVPLAAYGQDRLEQARRDALLVLVEGESDCWALWYHRLPALGIPGSNAMKCLEAEHLDGITAVYIVREPDAGGERFIPGCLARLKALRYDGRAFEVRMPGGVKDAADLHADDPEQFVKRLGPVLKAAPVIYGRELPSANSLPLDGRTPGPEVVVPGLAMTCLDTVRPVPVRWLVPDYLPLGKLVLLAGDGGHGKSTLLLHLAAALSVGRPAFGLDYPAPLSGETLLIQCEDDAADTVVPRFLAAGGDISRVHLLEGVRDRAGKVQPFCLANYEALEAKLLEHPGIRLVGIDPAGAYVSPSGVDDHKDSELRALLGPLAQLAARRRVTVALVKHLVKGATDRAVHKVSGSAGYVNSVRAAFVVAPAREDPDKKLFLPLKFNLGRRPSGLSYRLEALGPDEQKAILDRYGAHLEAEDRDQLAQQLFAVKWGGPVDATADAVFAAARRADEPGKVEKAAAWLAAFLKDHAYPSQEIVDAGKAAGFTFDNIKEAKVRLKEKGLQSSNKGRFQGEWWTGFGHPGGWTLRPSPLTPHSPQTPHYGQDPEENHRAPPIVGRVGSPGSEGSGSPQTLPFPAEEEGEL
jgi:hypothetical protein